MSAEVVEEQPYDPAWYLDFARRLAAERAGSRPVAAQREAVTELYRRFRRNLADNDKRVLTDTQLDEFLDLTRQIATRLDAAALGERIRTVPEHFRRYLLAARGESAGPATVELRSLMSLDGEFVLHGFVDSPLFGGGDEVRVHVGGDPRVVPDAGLRTEYRYFGRVLVSYRAFDLRLPLAHLAPGTRLWFEVSVQPGRAPLRFATAAARLAPDLGCRYVDLGPLALRYAGEQLRVERPSRRAAVGAELAALAGIRGAKLKPYDKLRELGLRLVFNLTRGVFRRKRLVLYFDKLYMGGDNGQYLFEYASARAAASRSPRPGERSARRVEHRYVVHPDAAAYARLKGEGRKLVNFAGWWRKLYALNAELVVGTHSNVFAYCGLNAFERRWFSSANRARVVCVQHGLTVQHIPHLQARHIDNTERYYCASPRELANLRRPEYGYTERSLRLTGLARYDGLVPDPRPVVLICPTWRRYVANDLTRMGQTRGYTEAFVDSPFYRVYSRVLTDAALLAGLRERGHRIRFLLHPTLTTQVDDFVRLRSTNPLAAELVDISTAADEGYELHLRQAAVLVTDYSGIQFDFAVMRKPLVYFLPAELPPSYPMGDFQPGRDGFGPVVADVAALAAQVLAAIDRHAVPTAEYLARIDAFFPFTDRGNCARIYADLSSEYGLDQG